MTARLGLGSAQFGSPYGISNARGRVREDDVRQILELAAQNRILTIDVAPGDGDAERIVGRNWPFPSPFRPQIRTFKMDERLDWSLDWVETRLRRSVEHMGLARAHSALVDSAEDLMGPEGDALWQRLLKLKDEGLISQIGISARYEDRPALIAKRFKPDLMQVPLSILDQRLVDNGNIAELASLGIEVQVRSVFLQGLLFMPREGLPPALHGAGAHLSRIRRTLMEEGADPLHAALSFAMHTLGVSSVIVGVTSAAELRAIIAASERPLPDLDWSSLKLTDPLWLDPSRWSETPPEPRQLEGFTRVA